MCIFFYVCRGVLCEVLLDMLERPELASVPDAVDLDDAELTLRKHRLELFGREPLVIAVFFPLGALLVLALVAVVALLGGLLVRWLEPQGNPRPVCGCEVQWGCCGRVGAEGLGGAQLVQAHNLLLLFLRHFTVILRLEGIFLF